MVEKIIEHGIAFLALVVSFYAVYQNWKTNKDNNKRLNETDKSQKILYERSVRIETDVMFERIRGKKEVFEEYLGDLIGADESIEKAILLKTITKYWSLYNEVEAFCVRLNDKSVPTDEYVKKEIIPFLIKLSELQVECFKNLSIYTEKLGLQKMKKPDYGSFRNYDLVLKENLSNSQYNRLKEKRRAVRLYF